jgi:hypothetical protein
MRLPVLLLAAALAAPAAAQVVPDEFPDSGESMADRNNRELEERHLGFLSRFYGQSTVEAGPSFSRAAPVVGTNVEGGFRLGSGDAVAVSFNVRTALGEDPLTGGLRADQALTTGLLEYVVALDRRIPSLPAGAELALGVGGSTGAVDGTAVEVNPRWAIPLGGVTSLPVGLRASYAFGERALGASPVFVGLSVGMRYGYVSDRRMVLE